MSRIQLRKQVLFPLLGGLVISVSLLVMLGWVFNVPALTSISAVFPSMKFNTALAFCFAGAATVLIYRIDKKVPRYFYYTFSAIVLLTGFFSLLEFILGINFGIDNLFITDPGPASIINPHPGRMACGTALSFCLSGIAFFGMVSPVTKLKLLAQYALHIVTCIGYVACLGYIFNVAPSQVFSPFISVAIHTGIMFLVISFALTFYNEALGITGLFSGKGVGNIMVRRLFPVLVILTFMLGYMRIRFFSFHVMSIEFGVAISATVFLLVMLLLLWRTSLQINRLEEGRLQTEEANYKLKVDIATRETARREMDEVNKRNLLFVHQAPSAIAMFDKNMRYLAASEKWITDYNLGNKDIIGMSHYDVFPEIGESWKEIHRDCLRGNIHKADDEIFIRADGTEQWITWDVRPWYDNDNNVGGLLMYTADISNLKKKEFIIQETTERLAEAQQIAHIGSWDWNIVTGETKWSDELYRIAGLIPGQVKPHKGYFAGIANGDGAEKLKAITDDILNGKPVQYIQISITRPDGTQRVIETKAKVFLGSDGKPVRVLSTVADITERKKSETLIRETTERLAEAQQIAHVGSWDWDIINSRMTWSDEQYRIYGYEPGSVDPNSGLFYNMLHPDDKHRVLAALGDALTGTKPYATECRLVMANGLVRDVDARGRVLRNADGQPVRFIGTLADITERKIKETIIQETTERLAEAQQIAQIGSWDWDLVTDELKWSDEHYRIFGFGPGEIVPSTKLIFSMLHPDDRERMIAAGKARQTGESYVSEFRIVRADGKIRDIEARGKALCNTEGKPIGMVGTSADITERKKLERELALSEKEFRSSFENSAIGMALTSMAGRFIKVNNALARMVGYSQTELMDLTFMDITHPDSINNNVFNMQQLKSGVIDKYETEKKYIHKNGSMVWANLTVSVVFDEKQQPLYMVSQMSDITGRKQAERDLQKVNTELKSIFDAETHVSIIGTDMNGIITHFSRGAEILLGYKANEMIGVCSPVVIHDKAEIDARSKELSAQLKREIRGFEVFVALAKTRNFESREWTYVRKDGSRLPVQLVVSTTQDETGNIKGYLGIATDITERKNAEEVYKNNAILQSRNKEMEEFAYIASHDLQEPLRTVSSFITILTAEYGGYLPPEAQEYLEFITASTTRMRELIKGLLEYSRLGQRKTFEEVDCNKVVKEVIGDLGEAIKESGAVLMIDELPVINALPTEMHQLFQNLLSNAIKFRKKGVQPHVHVTAKALPDYWQFSVSDNGVGIDARHFHKIFILFQRLHNRRDYAGTGIGLSYCKKIVELHYGRIWVESVPGQGSQFFFTISNHIA